MCPVESKGGKHSHTNIFECTRCPAAHSYTPTLIFPPKHNNWPPSCDAKAPMTAFGQHTMVPPFYANQASVAPRAPRARHPLWLFLPFYGGCDKPTKKHNVHSHCATLSGRLQGMAAGGTDEHTTSCYCTPAPPRNQHSLGGGGIKVGQHANIKRTKKTKPNTVSGVTCKHKKRPKKRTQKECLHWELNPGPLELESSTTTN